MAENNNQKKRTPRPKSDRPNQNRSQPPNKDKFEWKKATRTLTFWVLIILGSIVLSQLYTGKEAREVEVKYTEFVALIQSGQVEEGVVIEKVFHGTISADALHELPGGGIHFWTVLPYVDQTVLEMWDNYGIKYSFKEKTTNWAGYLLTSILPWIILIGIWILLMRRMQGGGSKGIFSFGKSKAKLLTENHPKITFEDVAGADEAKEAVQEIIEFLKDPKKFQRLGGRIPRGALLLGPPGTGKTLLAKAIAGEADVPFFSMSGADFVEMFVGVGASRVRDLFEQGKKNAPCIIFIDEIDAVGRQRGAGLGGGHDEREQTLNQLLVEMDGFDSNDGVILVAATNRPDVLDPALLRPGRFDRQIVVDRPDVRGRLGILKVHSRHVPLGRDVNLETIAKGTPGMSGADLENIVNESALIAAKRDAKAVDMIDFESAKDKLMMGMERKSLIISDSEKKNTAYHESGHVLVAKMSPGSDPVHKVTIIPRGRALGLTHLLPINEKHNYSRSYLEAMLTHLLGGRVAEKVVLNEFTTGSGNDIERATEVARKMVCEWGMSEKLGPITFGKKEEEIFLGREIAKHRDYSEKTAIDIDFEVRKIIEDAQGRAENLIRGNLDKLHAIAKALLEREILDGHEIDQLMQGKTLKPVKKGSSSRRRKSRNKPKPRSGEQAPAARKAPAAKKTPAARQTPASGSARPAQDKPVKTSDGTPQAQAKQPQQTIKTAEKTGSDKPAKTAKPQASSRRRKSVTIRIKPEETKKPDAKSKPGKSGAAPQVSKKDSFDVADTDYPKPAGRGAVSGRPSDDVNFESANDKLVNIFKDVREESTEEIIKSISKETASSFKGLKDDKPAKREKLELQFEVQKDEKEAKKSGEDLKSTDSPGSESTPKQHTSSYARREAARKRAVSKGKSAAAKDTGNAPEITDQKVKPDESPDDK